VTAMPSPLPRESPRTILLALSSSVTADHPLLPLTPVFARETSETGRPGTPPATTTNATAITAAAAAIVEAAPTLLPLAPFPVPPAAATARPTALRRDPSRSRVVGIVPAADDEDGDDDPATEVHQRRMLVPPPRRVLVEPAAATAASSPYSAASAGVAASAPGAAASTDTTSSSLPLKNLDVFEGRNLFWCGGRLVLGPGWVAALALAMLILASGVLFVSVPAARLLRQNRRHMDLDGNYSGDSDSWGPAARMGLVSLILGCVGTVVCELALFRVSTMDPGILPRQRFHFAMVASTSSSSSGTSGTSPSSGPPR
jgi:hypothetical protein